MSINQTETTSLEEQAARLIRDDWFIIREAVILGQRELLRRAKLVKSESRQRARNAEALIVRDKILEFERLHYKFPDPPQ